MDGSFVYKKSGMTRRRRGLSALSIVFVSEAAAVRSLHFLGQPKLLSRRPCRGSSEALSEHDSGEWR